MSASRINGPHNESCRQVQKYCPTHWRSYARKKIYTSELKFCFHPTLSEHLISSLATLSWSYRLTLISIITDHNYIAGTRYACKSEGTELHLDLKYRDERLQATTIHLTSLLPSSGNDRATTGNFHFSFNATSTLDVYSTMYTPAHNNTHRSVCTPFLTSLIPILGYICSLTIQWRYLVNTINDPSVSNKDEKRA